MTSETITHQDKLMLKEALKIPVKDLYRQQRTLVNLYLGVIMISGEKRASEWLNS